MSIAERAARRGGTAPGPRIPVPRIDEKPRPPARAKCEHGAASAERCAFCRTGTRPRDNLRMGPAPRLHPSVTWIPGRWSRLLKAKP
jgi:hypothetical protein